MLTLQRPDPKVSALMGENKGIHPGDPIHPSIFAIPFVLGKRKIVFNTLTKQCIETELFSLFENPEVIDYDDANLEMKDLISADYLVAKGLDEAKKYEGLLSMLRRMEKPRQGYQGYTILPTTTCNARCVYCYEQGIKYETMSDEVAEQTIRYILATKKKGGRIGFRWFGGEPLMGEGIIDKICRAMRDAGVKYSSSMISNGSLMTYEMAEKAKQDWHLNNIQITLDGREVVYCERKRYTAFEGSPYKAVLNGIHALLEQNIKVNIRLNVDKDNIEELSALVDELETEFENDNKISIYCHGIFAETNDCDETDVDEFYDDLEILDERLEEFNRKRRNKSAAGSGQNNGSRKRKRYYDRHGHLKRYNCMVDNPVSGPVILPGGELHLCEHIGGIPTKNTIFDKDPIDRESCYLRDRTTKEKCRYCGLLPVCTDFGSCPDKDQDCYRERMIDEKRKLWWLENEKRLPPVNMRIEGNIIRVKEPEVLFLEENRELIVPFYLKPDKTVNMSDAKKLMGD